MSGCQPVSGWPGIHSSTLQIKKAELGKQTILRGSLQDSGIEIVLLVFLPLNVSSQAAHSLLSHMH